MVNSRLIAILRVCENKELRELGKWVHSPIHNQREDVIWLYNYLVKEDHITADKAIEKTKIFAVIYPDLSYDDAKMRQLVYFFMNTLEAFLLYKITEQNKIQEKIELARFYRNRKLPKMHRRALKYARDLQDKQKIRNSQFLRNEYLLRQEEHVFQSMQKKISHTNLQNVSNSLDCSFIADKLLQSCQISTLRKVYKTDYKIKILDEVIEMIHHDPELLDIPAIAIYYYGYLTISQTNQDDQSFENLKNTILEKGHFFPVTELRDIYLMAINYCIGKMNRGHDAYIREAFELFQLGFDKQVLLENNFISQRTFHNVVLIGLKLKDFDRVERFIADNQKYLDEKLRESFVNFSFALFYYEKKDYDKAMTYLLQYEHDDIIINLRAKNLLLKIYYEEDEVEVLISFLNSMNAYLTREKVMGYHKSNYKNVIRLTKKLLKVSPYDTDQKLKLEKQIKEADPLTGDDRKWLLTQLEKI